MELTTELELCTPPLPHHATVNEGEALLPRIRAINFRMNLWAFAVLTLLIGNVRSNVARTH